MVEVIKFETWAEKYFQISLHSWRDPLHKRLEEGE